MTASIRAVVKSSPTLLLRGYKSARYRSGRLADRLSKFLLPPWYCYDHDGMFLYGRNMEWLHDERFAKAYASGMDSGHRFSDIQIEWRVHMGCWAATHAKNLPGDFVECGVNTGILSLAVCNYIDINATEKSFFLFDTFCGIPEDQMSETERASRLVDNDEYYEECYETARKNFEPFPRAHLIRGEVPGTLSTAPIDKVCYLALDMNIAAPELAALEYFWDKLSTGAVVLLDDYGWDKYFEQKHVIDQFAASKNTAVATLPTGQGLMIKP